MWITERRDSILNLWDSFIRPLGKVPHNQFIRATDAVANEFARTFIWLQLFRATEQTYICLSDTKYLDGRNHLKAERLHEMRHEDPQRWGFSECFETAQEDIAFYTNPLVVGTPDAAGHWAPPSIRVWGNGQYSFTFEFDEPDVEFFQRQLSWCRV